MSPVEGAKRLGDGLEDSAPARVSEWQIAAHLRAMVGSCLPAGLKGTLFFWLQRRVLPARNSVFLNLPVSGVRLWYLRTVLGWSIGEGTTIERGLRVIGSASASVGRFSHINSGGTVLDVRGDLIIGDHVDIGAGVRVLTADHEPHDPNFAYRERRVDIGNRVWVATGVIVLPDARIDDGVICAAGSIVRGHLESDGIYAGNPGRRVAERSPAAQSQFRPSRPRW